MSENNEGKGVMTEMEDSLITDGLKAFLYGTWCLKDVKDEFNKILTARLSKQKAEFDKEKAAMKEAVMKAIPCKIDNGWILPDCGQDGTYTEGYNEAIAKSTAAITEALKERGV